MELDELRRISAKEELSLNFIAKDEMISRVLAGLQGFDDIILKGGTAVNLPTAERMGHLAIPSFGRCQSILASSTFPTEHLCKR